MQAVNKRMKNNGHNIKRWDASGITWKTKTSVADSEVQIKVMFGYHVMYKADYITISLL